MKKCLTVLLILIVSVAYSQDTIPITIVQAKQAIRNAQRVATLSIMVKDQQLLISGQELQLALMQDKVQNQQLRLTLLQENNTILNTQLEVAEASKPKKSWLGKLAIVIGVFSTGYIVGSL